MPRYGLVIVVAGLSAMLVGSLLVGVTLGPGRRPETWETALQRHLAFKASGSGESWQVAMSEYATSSVHFDRKMSRVSYGTGTHYQPQVVYQTMTPIPSDTRVVSAGAVSTSTGGGLFPPIGGRPLPYPPDEVWCLLLTQEPPGATLELVYVALHMDLYNAEWAVHEVGTAPFDDAVFSGLKTIGCEDVATMLTLDSPIR
ncbi:MAG: hypothetical protein MUF84_16520 [Anaerolineae bacterium]|jgi:hypothetical protein|nr:hypothetical protein [Anaerolineae bacterium]